MVAGRLRGAVADVAETLRRLFREVPVHRPSAALGTPVARGIPPLEARAVGPDHRFGPVVASPSWWIEAAVREEPARWVAWVVGEDAWERWNAGASVLELEVFRPAGRRRLAVPPLPRAPRTASLEPGGFRILLRQHRQPLKRPGVFRAAPALLLPAVHRDLDRAMGLPVALVGEDLGRIPKVLWMRYTLALVKATGENIRALEVLGLFRVPARGVAALRHEARTGRLLLELTREASGAPRVPLILARRREDHAILTCFPEDGS